MNKLTYITLTVILICCATNSWATISHVKTTDATYLYDYLYTEGTYESFSADTDSIEANATIYETDTWTTLEAEASGSRYECYYSDVAGTFNWSYSGDCDALVATNLPLGYFSSSAFAEFDLRYHADGRHSVTCTAEAELSGSGPSNTQDTDNPAVVSDSGSGYFTMTYYPYHINYSSVVETETSVYTNGGIVAAYAKVTASISMTE